MKYQHNKSYKTVNSGPAYYLKHENGASIRTDRFINMVWQKANGRTAQEIKKGIGDRIHISDWILDVSLKLMVAADLLSSDEKEPSQSLPTPPTEGPVVSVVIVNKDGERHLETLLPSLKAQNYKQIEKILVDNGSKDNSVAFFKSHFPGGKVVELSKNIGFAGGNNLGIEQATGKYIFLLNNDTRIADDCVSQLVAAAGEKSELAAIVPKMFQWQLPKFLNAIGNSVQARGWGGDNYIGYLDIGQFDQIEEVFSACFGAVMISRDALDAVGLLDPKYLFYYEDSDWSYRARQLGLKIYFAPRAVVYHKFNASMKKLKATFKWKLVISNRLRFALKNLSWGTWLNFMRNYVKEDIFGFLRSIKHREFGMALTYVRAWVRFLVSVPGIMVARRKIQKQRLVKDAQLFKLWPELPPLMDSGGSPIFDLATIRRIYLHFLPGTKRFR